MVPDESYSPLGKLLLDPKISMDAQRLLFQNVKIRPDYIGLPYLLQLAKVGPQHPYAEEAQQQLVLRFGTDHGSNWNLWSKRIADELKDR